jgi:hypothetical protein
MTQPSPSTPYQDSLALLENLIQELFQYQTHLSTLLDQAIDQLYPLTPRQTCATFLHYPRFHQKTVSLLRVVAVLMLGFVTRQTI